MIVTVTFNAMRSMGAIWYLITYPFNHPLLTLSLTHSLIQVGLSILDQLLTHDELIQEKRQRNIFECFDEDRITFPPTYQYIPGTPEYDRRPGRRQLLIY